MLLRALAPGPVPGPARVSPHSAGERWEVCGSRSKDACGAGTGSLPASQPLTREHTEVGATGVPFRVVFLSVTPV